MDTTRADALGCYGQALPTTPNLDALAAEGARFDRAYTVTPLTIPAHSSIMTGLWPPRHGVRDNGDFFLGDDATTLAERLQTRGYATMASVGAEVTSHHWGFAQGFDPFFDDMGAAAPGQDRWKVERTGDHVVDDALGWLTTMPKERPWFGWVHLFDAHHPYTPPPDRRAAFPGRPYLAEVSFVDAQIGRLVEAVKARGEYDHTWIVVVADHGEGLGDHGEAMHGVLLYDATTRVPMIIHAPGARGAVVSTPVSLVDLAPTILAAAGVTAEGLDGQDLGPLLRGGGDPARVVYAESLYAFHHYGWSPQRALVTDTHKLIDSTTPELYARADTTEADNLAPQDATLLQGIVARLERFAAAMTPGTATAANTLDPERVAQLEALGYLTATATTTLGPNGELPRGLPDPRAQMPVLADVERARQALQSGDLATARARVESAIARDPGLADPQMLLAGILARQGDLRGAYDVAARLDAVRPGSQSKAMMGTLQLQLGRSDLALPLLREALRIDPYLSNAWLPYLRALGAQMDPAFPAETERGRRALPNVPAIEGLAGYARAMSGRVDEAEPLLQVALAADPTQPMLNHGMGLVLAARGAVAGAESSFLEEVRLFPPALPSRRELVKLYADQQRYAEQLEQLDVIRGLIPPEPLTLHSTAQVLFNLKRFAEAGVQVGECLDVAPEYAGCVMLQANVLEKLGRHAEAVAAYERALKLVGQQKPAPGAPSGTPPGTPPGTPVPPVPPPPSGP